MLDAWCRVMWVTGAVPKRKFLWPKLPSRWRWASFPTLWPSSSWSKPTAGSDWSLKQPSSCLLVVWWWLTSFGHLINGSLALYVYASQKDWETFDPHKSLCDFFGVSMAFFGLTPLLLGGLMAVERCIGVTRPLFHVTVRGSHHVRRLLGLTWLLGLLVALLPLLLQRSYQVQRSRSWCFFRLQGLRDWVDVLLPMLFSALGLLALLVSLVCNTVTFLTLLRIRVQLDRDHHHHCRKHITTILRWSASFWQSCWFLCVLGATLVRKCVLFFTLLIYLKQKKKIEKQK